MSVDTEVRSRREYATQLGAALSTAVDRVPLIVGAIFVAAALCVTFGVMHWWLFIPVAAILTALTWGALPTRVASDRRFNGAAVVAWVGAAGWYLVNAPFASEYMVPIRDPGIYMVTGAVVAQTGGTDIGVAGALAAVAELGFGSEALGPFRSTGDVIQLQGSSSFSALLAIGYWLAGTSGAIQVNLVLGSVALVALYGLARRIVEPRFALLAPAVLSFGMPFVYLSRTSYTEIITMTVMVASATWTISAFKSGRLTEFAVAGAFAGSAALTRIDGALGFTGIVLGFIVLALGLAQSDAFTKHVRGIGIFSCTAIGLILMGILDLALNQPRYLRGLGDRAIQLWLLTLILLLVLALITVIRRWKPFDLRPATVRITAIAVTGLLAVLIAYWLSRPLWMINRFMRPGYRNAVASLQANDGLPIDPARSYDEYSLWWYSWYWGLPFLLLALAGICIWVWFAIRDRNLGHIVAISTIAVAAMLYLNALNITPDQVWAFRRILPVITPGLMIGFAIACHALWIRRRPLKIVAGTSIVLTAVLTAATWGQLFFTVEGNGLAREIDSICDSVGEADLVVLMAPGSPPNYAVTLRAVCGQQLITVGEQHPSDLVPLFSSGWSDIAIVAFDDELLPWSQEPPPPTAVTELHMWNRHLMDTPRTTRLSLREVFVATLSADGTVSPR